MISNILPKTTCMAITVMKTDTAEAKGGIAITKSSAKPEMTDGNSAYSLAGAEYGVYKQGTEEQVATLVTDVNGYGKVEDIPAGNYDIRELKAPAGYALDTATGTVTVTGGQTVAYSCQDTHKVTRLQFCLERLRRIRIRLRLRPVLPWQMRNLLSSITKEFMTRTRFYRE